MLAHKAEDEGIAEAENIAGQTEYGKSQGVLLISRSKLL